MANAHGGTAPVKGSPAQRQERGADAPPSLDVVHPSPGAADVAQLYRANADTVARWVARLGGPLIDVEDAVQEVFMIAQRRRPTLEGPARITTWLYRVTVKVVSHRRRKDRIRSWLVGSAVEAASQRGAQAGSSPIEDLEARERAALVYRVLDRLSEKQRAMIVLFEMEGLSGEEIATLYGARPSTVWVWLHRARAAFLARLMECDPALASTAAAGALRRNGPGGAAAPKGGDR